MNTYTIKFIVVVSIVLLGTGLVYHQVVNGQQQQQGDIVDPGDETRDTVDQGDVRQFLELGEEKYRQECNKDIEDNKVLDDIMNEVLDYMPDYLREELCEKRISEIKNQTLGSIIEQK